MVVERKGKMSPALARIWQFLLLIQAESFRDGSVSCGRIITTEERRGLISLLKGWLVRMERLAGEAVDCRQSRVCSGQGGWGRNI